MKKTTKNDLKNLSVDELRAKVDEFRRDLFTVRLHSVTRPLKDVGHFRKMRKDIARALTFLRLKRDQV